jgi:hypothetical protein
MSQYRDHQDAARYRIDALEAKLAEQQAQLEAHGAALSDREAEIAGLRRDLMAAGMGRPALVARATAAWVSRMVAGAFTFCALSGGIGFLMMGRRAVAVEQAYAAPALTLADPAPLPAYAEPPPAPPNPADRPTIVAGVPAQGPPEEEALRRQLEPRVWSGKGSVGDIKMLKAICSHLGDHACRDRAAAMLKNKLAETR